MNLDTIQRHLDEINAERADDGQSDTALLFQLGDDKFTVINTDNMELIEPCERRWYDGYVTPHGVTLF